MHREREFETSVHGVVVHTRMRRAVRPGIASASGTHLAARPSRGPARRTRSDPRRPRTPARPRGSTAPCRSARSTAGSCGRDRAGPFRSSVASAHHTLSMYSLRVRDVGIVVVEPVADALAQLLPVAAVLQHALAAQPVELARRRLLLDVLLAADAAAASRPRSRPAGRACPTPPCAARDSPSSRDGGRRGP